MNYNCNMIRKLSLAVLLGASFFFGGGLAFAAESDQAKDSSSETRMTEVHDSNWCLECHSTDADLAFWDLSKHSHNDVTCTDCHIVHDVDTPKPPKPGHFGPVDQLKTCLKCHLELRMQINKRSHHPIVEKKMACSSCHTPHGGVQKSMLKADSINELCYSCHADKRGPFLWEHPPVEEDCGACHAAHGSRQSKLLTERVPNLCQDCHDINRHPGDPYDENSRSNRFIARSCLNCHNSAIHGSTAPVNPNNVYNWGRRLIR